MYTTVTLLLLVISGYFTSTSQSDFSSDVQNLLMKTLAKTFETPISLDEANAKFSLDIMLENDVFTLDDALRLFIQQFLIALYDGRLDLLPDDWETRYPAYAKIIAEINNILDLIGKRTLSQINMKDIRPFIQSLKPVAMLDYLRLINTLRYAAKKEEQAEESIKTEL